MAKAKKSSAQRTSPAQKKAGSARGSKETAASKPPKNSAPLKQQSKTEASKPVAKQKTKTVTLRSLEGATFYHVIKRGSQWAVKREGAAKASGLYHTQAQAIAAARAIKTLNKHIFVHKSDGSIDQWIQSRRA